MGSELGGMDKECVTGFRREVGSVFSLFEFVKWRIYMRLHDFLLCNFSVVILLLIFFSSSSSCDPVLEVCRDGLTAVNTWLGNVRSGRITYFLGIRGKERDEQRAETVRKMKELKDKIIGVLELFRNEKRFVNHITPNIHDH